MTTLRRVSAWVDHETKQAFNKAAKTQDNTESGLLGLLIGTFLNRNSALIAGATAEGPSVAKTDKVTVRFTEDEGQRLLKLSGARGLKRSAYLGGLFRVHAGGEPYFTGDEIDSLREANRQLAAMARSVNQAAKALYMPGDHSGLAKAVEYTQLKQLIDAHRQEVKALIRANLKSWGQVNGD
jgi:hypothetical protein